MTGYALSCAIEDTGIDVSLNVRLADQDSFGCGRVEALYQGPWSAVCVDPWGDGDSSVVCRQLGRRHVTVSARCCARYGEGTWNIWMDNIKHRMHWHRLDFGELLEQRMGIYQLRKCYLLCRQTPEEVRKDPAAHVWHVWPEASAHIIYIYIYMVKHTTTVTCG
jgi:hypothetical protein